MGRAEVSFGKDNGDFRERDNVRAHFRQLVAHGYQLGAGELAQLASPFGIDSLEPPAPTAWRSGGFREETTPVDADLRIEDDEMAAAAGNDRDAGETDE